jgi:hypothetical protein
MHLQSLILIMYEVDLIIRRYHTSKLGVHAVQISLHPATLHLSLATILLADVAVEAVASPAFALLWARTALYNVLKHMPGLWLELVVIVRTTIGSTHALEMEAVTGLLLMEACVVDRPLFLCRWADVVVETLRMLVERNVTWCCARGKESRDTSSIWRCT